MIYNILHRKLKIEQHNKTSLKIPREVIRSRKSKDRQYNGQKKKNKRTKKYRRKHYTEN